MYSFFAQLCQRIAAFLQKMRMQMGCLAVPCIVVVCLLCGLVLLSAALEALCYGSYASPYHNSFCKSCENIMKGRRACTSVFFKKKNAPQALASKVAPQVCLPNDRPDGAAKVNNRKGP
ncbi:MAG: hypothetical protein V6Z78_02485 [Holosporaceae bacterium]